MGKRKSKYAHGEAFCLMWYSCSSVGCMHRERLWNSRDGVAPFALGCPSCGEVTLQHEHWEMDQRSAGHVCPVGQRFFRDGTPDEALAAIERRIVLFAQRGQPIPDDIQEDLRRDALNSEGEWVEGWPTVCMKMRDGTEGIV